MTPIDKAIARMERLLQVTDPFRDERGTDKELDARSEAVEAITSLKALKESVGDVGVYGWCCVPCNAWWQVSSSNRPDCPNCGNKMQAVGEDDVGIMNDMGELKTTREDAAQKALNGMGYILTPQDAFHWFFYHRETIKKLLAERGLLQTQGEGE